MNEHLSETTIVLRLSKRTDDSYIVAADDHPMFSVVGSDLGDALRIAAEILPEYRIRNGRDE